MGFLENLRDRLRPQDDYYDDEMDYYEEDSSAGPAYGRSERPERTGTGILGNTRRPEAESVSVIRRGGRAAAVDTDYAPSYTPAARPQATVPSYRDDFSETAPAASSYSSTSVLGNTTQGHTPADIGLKPVARSYSGQLPPYVLKPASYDDVQMVVRRVKTNQPVVLSFKNTNIETAKRILDFSFGLACGVGGRVDELGDRVFVVLPADLELSDSDIDKLVADGTISR